MGNQEREQPLGVFICSTKLDLKEERDAIILVIRKMGEKQHSMELFGARPDQPIDTCLNEVDRCGVMIVIVAHMYGALVDGANLSFSETEYDYGQKTGKPCIVYMPHADIKPTHTEADPVKRAKLLCWVKKLNKRHTVVFYKDILDLVPTIADG